MVPQIVKSQILQHARVALQAVDLAVIGIDVFSAPEKALSGLAERARVFPATEYPASDMQRS